MKAWKSNQISVMAVTILYSKRRKAPLAIGNYCLRLCQAESMSGYETISNCGTSESSKKKRRFANKLGST